jgi:hypothetical protein
MSVAKWRVHGHWDVFLASHTEGAHFLLVGAQSDQTELGRDARELALEGFEAWDAATVVDLEGHDEMLAPGVREPAEQELGGAVGLGDDVAQEPIDGIRGLEAEGVAALEVDAPVLQKLGAELGAVNRRDSGSPLDGDVGPASG